MVEIIFVLVIISVLVCGIIPLYSAMGKFQTDYETVLLVQRLKYLREISRQVDDFPGVPGRKYELEPKMYLDTVQHRYLCRTERKIKQSWSYSPDIHIACNRSEICFSKTGEATNGTYTISKGKAQRRVIIDRVGRIRIE